MNRSDARQTRRKILTEMNSDISTVFYHRSSLLIHFLKISAILCLCGLIFVSSHAAQDSLPDEIRGYKVHRLKESPDVDVRFGEPKLIKVTPLGATFEVTAEMTIFDQKGKIDFLAFRDFRVNNLKVEIEEYTEFFEIEKNKTVRLKRPLRIFVNTSQSLKGGLTEVFRSQPEWRVTGKVFVFGKFKKLGFKFKRVVPVDVNLKIDNPIQKIER